MMSPQSLLQLLQLASPALPVGGFSYSEVLEAAVDTGRVSNEAQAQAWLLDQLQLVLARADLPACAQALTAWIDGDLPRVRALNDWVVQTRESSELRQQALQMGRSLVEWLRNKPQADPRLDQLAALQPGPTWPVAFALALAQSGAPTRDALLAHAFGWAENMVAAAVKAVPLGQLAGQRILAALGDQIPPLVEAAIQMRDDDRQAFAPMLAILSSQHETQYSRLFRS